MAPERTPVGVINMPTDLDVLQNELGIPQDWHVRMIPYRFEQLPHNCANCRATIPCQPNKNPYQLNHCSRWNPEHIMRWGDWLYFTRMNCFTCSHGYLNDTYGSINHHNKKKDNHLCWDCIALRNYQPSKEYNQWLFAHCPCIRDLVWRGLLHNINHKIILSDHLNILL